MAKAKAKKKPVKPKEKKPAVMGRPATFDEAIAARILEVARSGKTNPQIAAEVGIGLTTLSTWMVRYPDFGNAIRESKGVADDFVQGSLFQRACGYQHPAIKVFYNSRTGEIVTHKYTEIYPPDTTACIFWLKNRQPDRWRDRTEVATAPGAPMEVVHMTQEQRVAEIKRLQAEREALGDD